MKAYIAYSRSNGSEFGGLLVIAHSVKEAKKLAWGNCWNVVEWTDLAVRWLRGVSIMRLADQGKLCENITHIVDDPLCCKACGLWGAGLTDEGKCGYCNEDPGNALVYRLAESLLVVAGDFSQFRDWLRRQELSPDAAVYVGDHQEFYGRDPLTTTLVFVGSYWHNAAYKTIERELEYFVGRCKIVRYD